jgi:hypothetical protein
MSAPSLILLLEIHFCCREVSAWFKGDRREFMSGLPAVLHQQGFRLTPITLEV